VQLLNNAGADTAGFDELLNAGFANAYQGEFGRGKERVGCDQEQDQKHPDQHKCDHGWGNSNISKAVPHSHGGKGVVR